MAGRDPQTGPLAGGETAFRRILEEAGAAIAWTSPGGRLHANAAARALLGYTEEEIARLAMHQIVAPADLRLRPLDPTQVERKSSFDDQRALLCKDGSKVLVHTTARPLPDGCVVVSLQEVSDSEREAVHLRLMQDVAVASNASIELEDACRICIERLCETHDFAFGQLWLPSSEAEGTLVASDVWHAADRDRERFAGLRQAVVATGIAEGDGSLPAGALSTGEPAWMPDARVHPDFPLRSAILAAGLAASVVLPVLAGGGVVAVLELFAAAPRDPDSALLSALAHLGTVLGRTAERRRAHREIHEMQSHLDLALRAARAGTWRSDLDGSHVRLDERLRDLLEIEEGSPSELAAGVHPEDRDRVANEIRKSMDSGDGFSLEFRALQGDGTIGIFESQGRVVSDRGAPPHMLGVTWDVTDRRDVEERLHRLSYLDPLTGLPNRRAFQERLAGALENARRNEQLALLCLNLDRFKQVNESLGYRQGDRLLRLVVDRLLEAVGSQRSLLPIDGPAERAGLARLGADEFALMLSGRLEPEDLARLAERMLGALSLPFDLDGNEVFTNASLGIAVAPGDGSDDDTLLTNAQTALGAAKDSGHRRYHFFASSMNGAARSRLSMETLLRSALRDETLQLLYQPIVSAQSGEVVEAEALVRLPDPSGGFLSPADFIPLAEATGLIDPLGDWVLREALRQARAWRDAGHSLPVSVNISTVQLRTKGLAERIDALLREAGLPPEILIVEVTESAVLEDEALGLEVLGQIRALGVELALDDFGTGFSSLTRLNRMPLTRLKIDREFARNAESDRKVAVLVQCILAMSRALGLVTVGEGVENEADAQFLTEHGCDLLQGYLFAPPLEAEAFEHLLATGIRRKPSDA